MEDVNFLDVQSSKFMTHRLLLVPFFLHCMLVQLQAKPTAEREWKSTVGTSLTAIANRIEDGVVWFTGADGRTISVPLDKLAAEDRNFLLKHFKVKLPQPGDPVASKAAQVRGLPYPLGKTVASVAATPQSHYFLYLPKSLKMDRKAPLVFYTGGDGGKSSIMNTMLEGAELTGWIVAMSVESKNTNMDGVLDNQGHTKACLAHLISTLPVDEKRIYFAGSSGGAATAFRNASLIEHAGVISSVGFFSSGLKIEGGDYAVCGGAIDFNRYISAASAETLGKKNSILRYHERGHRFSPDWLMTDAMIWLNLRYLSGKGSKLVDERLDFETAILRWFAATRGAASHRAYHAALQMKESFKLSSANSASYDIVLSELGNETNQRYAAGILTMDVWARKNLGTFGGGSNMNHTTPALQSAAKKLSEELAGVPELELIALRLGEVTDKLGK